MSDQLILTQVENKVATLTFNRPDKLNALNRDTQIGAIVVTGSGRAFCAGGDVGNMAKDGQPSSIGPLYCIENEISAHPDRHTTD